MNRLHAVLIISALAPAACSSDSGAALGVSAVPDQRLPDRSVAGAGAIPQSQRWRGIQSCSGTIDSMVLETTSEETSITSYTKTATRVHAAGIRVGPSSTYSCGPLDFDGVVRSNSVSTMFASSMAQQCTSPSGTALVASGFGGDDLDQRSPSGLGAGKWNLSFQVSLREPEDRDAGVSSKVRIICNFELTLQ